MADYISRQKAIEAIMDLPNCPNGYSDTYDKACIIGTLEEVPTADVVSVVRCKHCVHCDWFDDEKIVHWCDVWDDALEDDGFCHYGERRDDGDGTEAG